MSVRRRVVKLLRILYGTLDDEKQKVEICRNLVGRVLDEDEGVKVNVVALTFPLYVVSTSHHTCIHSKQDLAVDTLDDLWFSGSAKTSSGAQSSSNLSNVILNIVRGNQGRVVPIEEALRLIMVKHAEKEAGAPLDRLRDVMENLIDTLVANSSSIVSFAFERSGTKSDSYLTHRTSLPA